MEPTNRLLTKAIDATGELAVFQIRANTDPDAKHIGLNIDGDEAASYAVDVGAPDGEGGVRWISQNEAEYTDSASVSDGWRQTEKYLRIRVTTAAATTGSSADLYVSRGE